MIVAQAVRNRLGLAFLVGGAGAACWLLTTAWGEVPPRSSGRPLLQWAAWLDNWVFVGLIVLVTWPLLLFPTGGVAVASLAAVRSAVLVATSGIGLAGILDPGAIGECQRPSTR